MSERKIPPELIDLIHGQNSWTPADILEAFNRGVVVKFET